MLYRQGMAVRSLIKAEIDKKLEACVNEQTSSEWASILSLIPQKDGSLQIFVENRRFKSLTRSDACSFSRMKDCIDSLGTATVFSKPDRTFGY